MTTLTCADLARDEAVQAQMVWTCGPDDGSRKGNWHQVRRIRIRDGNGWREIEVKETSK